MCTIQASSSRPAAPIVPTSSTTSSPQTTLDAAEHRKKARTLLLQLDRDFLTAEESVMIFDLFGTNNDYVDAYLVLALEENMYEVRQSWLKTWIKEAQVSKGTL